jgi:hypothetical protein
VAQVHLLIQHAQQDVLVTADLAEQAVVQPVTAELAELEE